ncbi:MAG: ATP-binding protein, partial [Anaerolineae bacterium]|nr:ATP-binding protein [Anaerolineae bacterium]
LYVSEAEVDGLLARPLGSNWGQTVSLPAVEAEAFTLAEAQARQSLAEFAATAQAQAQRLRLLELATAFGLSRFELDALLICLAPSLDLRYERIYGYLQDDVTRKRPSVNLILDLLSAGPTRWQQMACFAPTAPLLKYRLLELSGTGGADPSPVLSQTLRVDPAVVAWLLGQYQPHAHLEGHAHLSLPANEPAPPASLLPEPMQTQLGRLVQQAPPPIIICYGPDRVGQEAAAWHLARQTGRALLQVDLAAVVATDQLPLTGVRLALRDARLTGALPCLLGWEACLEEGSPPPALLEELYAYPEAVIVAGQAAWHAAEASRSRRLFWLEFPVPAYDHRLALWHHFLAQAEWPGGRLIEGINGHNGGSGSDHLTDLELLAGQFGLTISQIRDTVASAKDLAVQRGTETLHKDDLFQAARSHSNPRLASLARKIVPRYDWDDIILPMDQRTILQEIVTTVQGRPQVLEQWGVGRKLASSAAVTVLFAGDPGTGKTMAAEVIARVLKLDLYKIDLSTMVSKYIGETEKNLEKIFSEAESSNAILFFDEADAIFGKRSEVKDAHDRYANIEVSYLLQRMEAYDGVTILATNLRANLDEAFTRRLQFAVDFPFPEAEDRLRIWQTLFPPEVPRRPDLDFDLLAKRFKLAGGNIRNIIINAAYQAAADGGQVTMAHLLHGTRRELQKMGRWVGEDDLRI